MKKRNELLGKAQTYDKRCRMLPINNATSKDQKFGEYDTLPYTVRLRVCYSMSSPLFFIFSFFESHYT